MAAKGYAQVEEVAAFVGATFTSAQEDQAERMLEVAEAEIDAGTNRGWLVGAQANETHRWEEFRNGDLWLRYAPVSSVTAVKGRAALGEAESTLTADLDYEVIDLEAGWIRIVSPGLFDRIRVDYTPSTTVPTDIQQATAELAAAKLQSTLRPQTYGLDSLQLPDLSVGFNRSINQNSVPPAVADVIARWRYRVAL